MELLEWFVVLALFGVSTILHESGHYLMAKRFGSYQGLSFERGSIYVNEAPLHWQTGMAGILSGFAILIPAWCLLSLESIMVLAICCLIAVSHDAMQVLRMYNDGKRKESEKFP